MSERPRHSAVHRAAAYILLYALPATAFWSVAPPPALAAGAPVGATLVAPLRPALGGAVLATYTPSPRPTATPSPRPTARPSYAPAPRPTPTPIPLVCENDFWGPMRFTRTTGPKNVYTVTVAVPAWIVNPYVLNVQNGEPDGRNRVSSAWIEINGQPVAEPSDFNQNVAGLSRNVTLTPITTLKVTLASKPQSYLTINLCGATGDRTKPVIRVDAPPEGSFSNDPTPSVIVRYSDPVGAGEPAASGVDTSTLKIRIDGVDRTGLFTIGPSEAVATLPADLALSEGSHRVTADISDVARNAADPAASHFAVDVTPPTIQVPEPPRGDVYLPNLTQRVRVTYQDNIALDLASLRILVNGVDRRGEFEIGPNEAVATLTLPEGPNVVKGEISDRAANPAVPDATDFNLDVKPPAIKIEKPPLSPPARYGDPMVAVVVSYSDDQKIDVGTFELLLDGAPVSIAAGLEGATGTIGPVPDGWHTLDARILDKARNLGEAPPVRFHVDTKAPTVEVLVPLPGSQINDSTPILFVGYEDDDLDLDSLVVKVGATDITALCERGPNLAKCPLVDPLAEGPHTVFASIADKTGNQGSDGSGFIVDTVAPEGRFTAPAPKTGDALPEIVAAYSDATTGINRDAVKITLDGLDITARLSPTESRAAGTPPGPLADGEHRLTLYVEDKATNNATIEYVFLVDQTKPTIAFVRPARADAINDATPEIDLVYEDAGLGVVPESLRVFLRRGQEPEREVTSYFTPGPTGAQGTVPDAEPLQDETFQLRASIDDVVGNRGETDSSFVLDTKAPSYRIDTPPAIVGTSTPRFRVFYEDNAGGTGIDKGTFKLLVDGLDRTERMTVGDDQADGVLLDQDALADGVHTAEVAIGDKAGNAGTAAPPTPTPFEFTVDTTPLVVAIKTPGEATWVKTAVNLVRAEYSDVGGTGIDPTTVRIEIDGTDRSAEFTVSATEAQATITFADGLHAIRVAATDFAGNETFALRTFTVDTRPPDVANLGPGDGSYVAEVDENGRIQITGQWADFDPETTIVCTSGGVSTTATKSGGEFSCTAPLVEGGNDVKVEAVDRAGNRTELTPKITLDTIAPIPNFVVPEAGIYTSAQAMDVSGWIDDAHPDTIKINEVAGAVDEQTKAFVVAALPLGDKYELDLVAVATDKAGNVGTNKITIFIDRTPPDVDITAPAGEYVLGPSVAISATVQDESPIVAAEINGAPATVENGVMTRTLEAEDGPLPISAVAFDAAMNPGDDSKDVTVDSKPPVVVITSPAPGTQTCEASIEVTGTVQDLTPVTLTVCGQPVTVVDEAFQATCPVATGTTTITAVAKDSVGLEGSGSVDVKRDGTAPVLQISTPPAGDVIGTPMVTVAGTVTDESATEVWVDGTQAQLDGKTWWVTLGPFADGQAQTFTATAKDACGLAGVPVQRAVTFDLAAPVVTLAPAATCTREGTVLITGTVVEVALKQVVVRVGTTSYPASVQSQGSPHTFSATVDLADGENLVVAVATDNTGREGSAGVEIRRDSTDPKVTLNTPETVSPAKPGEGSGTVDETNLTKLEVRIGDGAFTELPLNPSFTFPIPAPPGKPGGETFEVEVRATDCAGHTASVTRGVRIASAGVVTGQVLSDATGFLLPGATVELRGAVDAEATSDDRGRYSLSTVNATAFLVVSKPGFTTVERNIELAVGAGTVPVDARVTPLAEEAVPSAGTTLTAGRVSIGGVTSPVRLTPLTPQGLPNLLPFGWSPVVAFDLREPAPSASSWTLSVNGLATTTPALVQYRPGVHNWGVVARQVAADSLIDLPGPGAYALVLPDAAEMPVAAVGEELEGLSLVGLSGDATARALGVPETFPPSGGTGLGHLVLESPNTLLPSGTVVQAEITESYALASGQISYEEPRRVDVVTHRLPTLPVLQAPEGALTAAFAVSPARTFANAELASGRIHLDILAGREMVRGQIGGKSEAVTVQMDELRLSIAEGSLPSDAAFAVGTSGLSPFVPAATNLLRPVAELSMSFSGETLAHEAEVAVDAPNEPLDGTYLVAKVVYVDYIPYFAVVSRAVREGAQLVTKKAAGLPGIRTAGRYVFFHVKAEVGLVAGAVSPSNKPLLIQASGLDALPFVGHTEPDGDYVLAALTGSTTVKVVVPTTALSGQADTVIEAGQVAPLNFALQGTSTAVLVKPAHGAQDVPAETVLELTASAPIKRETVRNCATDQDASCIRLQKLAQDENGNPTITDVGVQLAPSTDGRTISILPAGLLNLTSYRLTVGGLVDVFGQPVAAASADFKTGAPVVQDFDADKLKFSMPDENGLVHATAPVRALPFGTEIMIVNMTSGAVASFGLQGDGSVNDSIQATIDDKLLITITTPDGKVSTITKSEFVVDPTTGETAIGPGGGVVRNPQGFELHIEDGALEKGVRIKIEVHDWKKEGEPPLPDLNLLDPENEFPNTKSGVGAAIKISGSSPIRLKKEAKLVFPIPNFANEPGAPANPKDAFFFVTQRHVMDDVVFHELLDHAFVEGEGANAKVVTASPPFSGFIDTTGFAGTMAAPVVAVLDFCYSFIFWQFNDLLPGKPLPGVVNGRVLRPEMERDSTVPKYVGVPNVPVISRKVGGQPLISTVVGSRTQEDGTFAFITGRTGFTGQQYEVVARPQGEPEARATIYATDPKDTKFPGPLKFYLPQAFTANVILQPTPQPTPQPDLSLHVFRMQDGTRVDTNGMVISGTPLLIGVKYRAESQISITELKFGNTVLTRRPEVDGQAVLPVTELADFPVDPNGPPVLPGTYTIEVTGMIPFRGPTSERYTLLVIAPGGGNAQPIEGAPKVIDGSTYPRRDAIDVPQDSLIQLVFSEPVQGIDVDPQAWTVRLRDQQGIAAKLEASGVGWANEAIFRSNAPEQPIPASQFTANTVVTSVTLRPTQGLSFGMLYTLELGAPIHDFDGDAPEDHRPLEAYTTSFRTTGPRAIFTPNREDQIAGVSLAALEEWIYFLQPADNMGLNTYVQVFDAKNPFAPQRVTTSEMLNGRAADIDAEGDRVVAATTVGARNRPSNLYVLNVSERDANPVNPTDRIRRVGITSVTANSLEGIIQRIRLRDGRVYVIMGRKGVHVVDTLKSEELYVTPKYSPEWWRMISDSNLPDRGHGKAAVVGVIPVDHDPDGPGGPTRPRPWILNDLDVANFQVDGFNQPVLVAVGDLGLTIVLPTVTRVRYPTLETRGTLKRPNDEVYGLFYGTAVALTELTRTIAPPPNSNEPATTERFTAAVLTGRRPTGVDADGNPVIGSVLVVVDITNIDDPRVVGDLAITEMGNDIVVRDGLAVVSATSGDSALYNLQDPTRPKYAGKIEKTGSRLALTASGLIASTQQTPFWGLPESQKPLQGLHLTNMGSAFGDCSLLTLLTPMVSIEVVADVLNGQSCGGGDRAVFALCKPASVNFSVDGSIFTSRLYNEQGQLVRDGALAGLVLPVGLYTVDMPASLVLGPMSNEPTFQVQATDLSDPSVVKQEQGQIQRELTNRSMLPVGHTFVKGVDLFDGHLAKQSTDFTLNGRHLNLETVRTYSSAGRERDGLLGAGWSWNYDSKMFGDDCGRYTVITADGSSQVFSSTDGGQTFRPQKGYHTRLVRVPVADSQVPEYDFIDKAGRKHRFSQTVAVRTPPNEWRLKSITDPHGDRIQPSYDTIGRLARVGEILKNETTPRRSIAAVYKLVAGHDRIIQISSSSGHFVNYGYDEFGNLIQVTVNGDTKTKPKVEAYRYSVSNTFDRHNLIEHSDPNQSKVQYEYHRQQDTFPGEQVTSSGAFLILGKTDMVKKVIENDGASVFETQFFFDFSQAAAGKFLCKVKDPRGNDTTYTQNGYGATTIIEAPLGKKTEFVWMADDILKESEKDALGRETKYKYDSRGNLIEERIVTQDFGDVVTTYAYDLEFNKLTFKRDAEGNETTYAVNALGDLDSQTDAVGNVTTYRYVAGGEGLLEEIEDPRGNATKYRKHNFFGEPQEIEDARTNVGRLTYDYRGHKLSETDGRGHETKWAYDKHDRVIMVRREAGYDFWFDPWTMSGGQRPLPSDSEVTNTVYYPNGEVQQVTNGKGGVTTYFLDKMNRVVEMKTPTGSIKYTYDGNGNKLTETDRRGVTRTYGYDALNRVETLDIRGPHGGTPDRIASYGYNALLKTRETNLAGLPTTFGYDGLYRVKEEVLPEGNPNGEQYRKVSIYDKIGQLRVSRDLNGNPTTFQYDGLGRVIRVTNALNQSVVTEYNDPEGSHVNKSLEHDTTRGLRRVFTYDALNRELTEEVRLEGTGGSGEVYTTRTEYQDNQAAQNQIITDPRGRKTKIRYDGLDRELDRWTDTQGLNLHTLTAFDALGKPKFVVNARGHASFTDHDVQGRLFRIRDERGKTIVYGLDAEGLQSSETDKNGVMKTFKYDNLGRLRRADLVPTLTGVAWKEEVEYNDLGRTRAEIDAKGHPTVHQLDGLDRVLVATDARGETIQYTYDGMSKRSETDRRGNTTTFNYDALNRLTEAIDPAPFRAQKVVTTYDDGGNRRIVTDKRGIDTINQLDPLGRVVSVARAGVIVERNFFDGNNNKEKGVDAEGRETTFQYDGANRLVARTDGAGTPDAATTTFVLDPNGNVLREQDARAKAAGVNSITRVFDNVDRVVSVKDALGNETQYGYDGEGNRIFVQEPNGVEYQTHYIYDELDKLVSVDPPLAPPTTYKYDENRNRIEQKDGNGHKVVMGYDELDRMTSMTQDPDGLNLIVIHGYDENGNEIFTKDPKGQTADSLYDALNRLEKKTFSFAASDPQRPWRYTKSMDYVHDPNDNLTSVIEHVASGTDPPAQMLTTTRVYDAFDRVEKESVALPQGRTKEVTYSYFGNGTRKTVTADGGTTSYTYDGQNRLKTATTADGGVTTYKYLPDDLLELVSYPNAVIATHGYDIADRLTSLVNAKGATLVSSYKYAYDKNGNRLSQVEINGGATESTTYIYDALNRLKTIKYPVDATFPNGREVTYGYDDVGNRVSEITKDPTNPALPLSSKTATFDAINRLLKVTDADPTKTTEFTYDANGNQTSKRVGDPTEPASVVATDFFYDLRDDLVESKRGTTVDVKYQYDFDGRMVHSFDEQGLKEYLYDQTSRLVEVDPNGGLIARYDYGSDRLIRLSHRVEGDRFYSFDALGSVTGLTDPLGAVKATYHLDAWGVFRNPAERAASQNRIAYTGYIYSSLLDLYYAKARFYDPEVGRFTSQDSFLGDVEDPPSLHRYFYANDRPTYFVDPTGHSVWTKAWKVIKAGGKVSDVIQVYKDDVNYIVGEGDAGAYDRWARTIALATEILPISAHDVVDGIEFYDSVRTGDAKTVLETAAAKTKVGRTVQRAEAAKEAVEAAAEGDYATALQKTRQAAAGSNKKNKSNKNKAAAAAAVGAVSSKDKGKKPNDSDKGESAKAAPVSGDKAARASSEKNDKKAEAKQEETKTQSGSGGAATEDRYSNTRDARGRLRDEKGRYAPDGGRKPRPRSEGGHRNTVDDRQATLYKKYDKDGEFRKHGVTYHEDPRKRYTKNQIDGGTVDPVERGPRSEIIKKERELVETDPGPDNREPWAGKRKPTQAPKPPDDPK